MRLLYAGLTHESSSDAVPLTGLTTIDQFWVTRGEEVRRVAAGTRTVATGVLDAASALDIELVPGVSAGAYPSATIAGDAYQSLRAEILDSVRSAAPVDAVFLLLHGAASAEGVDDVEGDLATEVRAIVGDGVPMVAVLDLHGLVTADMVAAIDVMLGCHEYPHVDMYDRAVEAIELLPRIEASVRPVTHLERIPISVPMTATALDPVAGINAMCAAQEQRPRVVDCTFFHGYAYTDSPLLGASVVATTDDDPELAATVAREVAAYVWDVRESLRPAFLDPVEAVAEAMSQARDESRSGPVIIVDSADNPGAGSPGDNTRLLRALLDADADACLGYFCDPDAVAVATRAGRGSKLTVTLGGAHPELQGEGVELTALVTALSDGRFTLASPMMRGVVETLGPSARLTVDHLDIVVCSRARQVLDPGGFVLHGIDVTRKPVVAVKSRQHFRAGFRDIARDILIADGGGLSTYRVELMPRHRRPRPLWPFDTEGG